MTMTRMTNERGLVTPKSPYAVAPKETAIRLAHLVWKRSSIKQLPIGPQLISAMENWLVPIRVYDFWQPPPGIGAMFGELQDVEEFDANTVAAPYPTGVRYVVVYNGAIRRERVWWSLAHEFGHIVLQHARSKRWHDDPAREREANIFAAELLLPIGAVQEVRRWPVREIAELFGTSLEATKNRLKELAQGWLRLYAMPQIEEGRARFIDTLKVTYLPKPMTRGFVKMVDASHEQLAVVRWNQDMEVDRLKECPDCGFENHSLFKDQETRCGGCGVLLINACENAGCELFAHPLPSDYRHCGRCGHATSWSRLQANPRLTACEPSEPENDDILPDDLPF